MKLPTLPSNPITVAVEQAADQAADAAEQVFDAAIGAAEEASSGDGSGLRVLEKALSLTKAAKEEARAHVVALVDDEVASLIEAATASVMIAVALTVAALGLAVANASAAGAAASRVGLAMVRITVAMGAFAAARAAAEGQRHAQKLRHESAAVSLALADLNAEIRRLQSSQREQHGRISEKSRADVSVMVDQLDQLRKAASLLGDIPASKASGAPAAGGSASQPSTVKPDEARNLARIDRLANRLMGYAAQRSAMMPVVRAQVIAACAHMPRIARPGVTPKAILAPSPIGWRK